MTRSGRQIVQLLSFPLILALFIVYAIYYKYVQEISVIIRNIAPVAILVFSAVLVFSNTAPEARSLRLKGELERTMTISRFDIYIVTGLMLFVPVCIAAVSWVEANQAGWMDVMQAVYSFIPLYWIRKRYFHFRYHRDEHSNIILEDEIPITYYDSMRLDAISFFSAIIIVGMPGFMTYNVQLNDVLQAGIMFFAVYWLNVKYFKFL